MVLLLWLVAGAGLLGYCLLSTNNPNIATLLQVNAVVTKAVNREDKLSRRYRDRDIAKFESSRRYRQR
jgi:hypothetical protein